MSDIDFPAPPPVFTGCLSANVIGEQGKPQRMLGKNAPFEIEVLWEVGGHAAFLVTGSWKIEAFAESLGPGESAFLGQTTTPITKAPPDTWTVRLNVPPDTLTPVSGVYKILVVLSHMDVFGEETPICGFTDGPIIKVRKS